jgi:hypothetical protein
MENFNNSLIRHFVPPSPVPFGCSASLQDKVLILVIARRPKADVAIYGLDNSIILQWVPDGIDG